MTTTAHNQKTTLLGSGLAKPSLSRNKSLESSVKSALQDMKGEEKKKNMMNVPCKPYLLTKFYFYTDEVDEMRIKEDIEEYFDEECRISYQFNGKQASVRSKIIIFFIFFISLCYHRERVLHVPPSIFIN